MKSNKCNDFCKTFLDFCDFATYFKKHVLLLKNIIIIVQKKLLETELSSINTSKKHEMMYIVV